MNYSINFFLYVLSSSNYREKLLVVFRLKEDSSLEKSSSPWVSLQNINSTKSNRRISTGSLSSNQIKRISASANSTPLLSTRKSGGVAAEVKTSGGGSDPLLRKFPAR